jgi:hypothetical protein
MDTWSVSHSMQQLFMNVKLGEYSVGSSSYKLSFRVFSFIASSEQGYTNFGLWLRHAPPKTRFILLRCSVAIHNISLAW